MYGFLGETMKIIHTILKKKKKIPDMYKIDVLWTTDKIIEARRRSAFITNEYLYIIIHNI